jgi:chromate reductase
MADPVRILGISGSLRAGSYNTAALRAALELKPEGVEMRTAGIGELPLYNEDLRAEGYPPAVQALRDQVAWAEAILFVTPEYNFSVPGVLKNAIDWASRPPEPPFAGKTAAVMGASPGLLGAARAQYHLRQMGVFLDLHFINKPEVMIMNAAAKFDAAGTLTDEPTRGFVAGLLVGLRDFTVRLRTTSPT